MIKRHLETICFDKLFGRQMRFIAGPRQTGKTTLAKNFLKSNKSSELYYNWDLREVRDIYRKDPYFFESILYNTKTNKFKPWVCFDEIHKLSKWKNILKDYFDKYEQISQFVVTGSARMDWFKSSGDSLAGRYFLFHLLPLSLAEVTNNKYYDITDQTKAIDFITTKIEKNKYEQEALEQLLAFSGFPEPFLKASKEFHLRWNRDMIDRIIREDLRDITRIIDIENVATTLSLLPQRIGSLLSLNSIREDIGVSYGAIANYIRALRKAYVIFEVSAYSKNIARSIKKEKKCYFYDWTRCKDDASKLENYIALELKNMISLWNDKGIAEFNLYFIRTKDGYETDFLITRNNIPWCLFESKIKDSTINKQHYKHSKLLGDIPMVQITYENKVTRKDASSFFRISASRFFSS